MAQSEPDDAFDACQRAANAAKEKSFSYCETPRSLMYAIGRDQGLTDEQADADPHEIADRGPGDGSSTVRTRQWVAAQAALLVDQGEEPYAAINEAWREVSDEPVDETDEADADGVEAEETDEEPEADLDDEEPVADADESGESDAEA